jgi:diguanylate cyclase (GGDEF)-like protein/PAS domain S-box-containing protein
MKNWGIRAKVLFVALAPLAVIVTLLAVHFIVSRLNDLDQALRDRGLAIARQLAPACEYGVFSGNRAILAGLAKAALRESDVNAVAITDGAGNVLVYASNTLDSVHAAPSVRGGSFYEFRAPIAQSAVAVDDFLDTGAAPRGARELGWVKVELSRAATIQRQNRVLIEGLVITLIGLIGTTFLALRLAGSVTRPMRRLSRAVEAIKGGRFDQRVEVGSSGELGALERGVNAMAAALEAARDNEHKRVEDALYLEKVRAQVTLESIGDGVITTDAGGRVVYMNSVAEQFTGWRKDEVEGLPLAEVFRTLDERSSRPREYPLHFCLRDGNVVRHDSHHLLLRRDGHRFAIQDSAAPIRDRAGAIIGAVVVFHDMTEMQHMARRMAYLASHDPLTGLINRREFESRLLRVLESARSEDKRHAICYLDLDQFKIVNDTCGHVAGDELLKQIAHHLEGSIRRHDVLARLGGDEFGVILEDCMIDEASVIADQLRQRVKGFRFAWQDRAFDIGVSIGVVPISADSGSMTDVLSAADSACYVAKDRGRNCIHVYQPDDAALTQRHGEMQWVHRLNEGLVQDSFSLYCQAIAPIAEGGDRDRHFYEILVRLNENGAGPILPQTFIPAAERYHLMPAIDRRVITAAFGLLRQYAPRLRRSGGPHGVTFSINLSGQSLCDHSFLEFVVEQFRDSNVRPNSICFEITETAAIANLTRAQQFIARLKDMGCRFALDDFGSGLSSFGYLKTLPVDYLKIAGDFVEDIVHDPVDHAMVDAINQIGHIMGLTTIAESVETAAILNTLRATGVDYGQGFGIDPPRPFVEVLEQLAGGEPRLAVVKRSD